LLNGMYPMILLAKSADIALGQAMIRFTLVDYLPSKLSRRSPRRGRRLQ
jgi:hypothetical protein